MKEKAIKIIKESNLPEEIKMELIKIVNDSNEDDDNKGNFLLQLFQLNALFK